MEDRNGYIPARLGEAGAKFFDGGRNGHGGVRLRLLQCLGPGAQPNCNLGRCLSYSPRSVSKGSSEAARRAGTTVARSANTASTIPALARMAGLYQLIP